MLEPILEWRISGPASLRIKCSTYYAVSSLGFICYRLLLVDTPRAMRRRQL